MNEINEYNAILKEKENQEQKIEEIFKKYTQTWSELKKLFTLVDLDKMYQQESVTIDGVRIIKDKLSRNFYFAQLEAQKYMEYLMEKKLIVRQIEKNDVFENLNDFVILVLLKSNTIKEYNDYISDVLIEQKNEMQKI